MMAMSDMGKQKISPLLNSKADFPVFNSSAHGRSLHYLDNAATTQKPACVIELQNAWHAKYQNLY